jgi:pantoate--beta-alanine ligase
LHEGHRSLVRRAKEETGFVVVSIFVNPAQFGANEDLSKYPRTFAEDLEACEAEGVDLVFHPEPHEIYPDDPKTDVRVRDITVSMEGEYRPGHFDGVALVCAKLFNIVGPSTAFFGEKDAQQLRVVQRMVRDLDMPTEIVGCETVRDADGLALSSRNRYLSEKERERALSLPHALEFIKAHVGIGEFDTKKLLRLARHILDEEGADAVDYLEIVDAETLESLEHIDSAALVCGAIRIGKTRLIDNVTVRRGDR